MNELKDVDELTHKRLTSVPMEEWCPPMLPEGVNTHGQWTNNAAELLGLMLLPARRQDNFASSLLHTLLIIRRRHLELSMSVPKQTVVSLVPQRVLHKMSNLAKATDDEQCRVHGNPQYPMGDVVVTVRQRASLVLGKVKLSKTKGGGGTQTAKDRVTWSFVTGTFYCGRSTWE